jgi:hypothetical protein
MYFHLYICPLRYEETSPIVSSATFNTRTWSRRVSPQPTTSEEGSYVPRLPAYLDIWTVTLILLIISLIPRTIDYQWTIIGLWYYIRTINHTKYYYFYYLLHNFIKLICISTLFSLCCGTQFLKLKTLKNF